MCRFETLHRVGDDLLIALATGGQPAGCAPLVRIRWTRSVASWP